MGFLKWLIVRCQVTLEGFLGCLLAMKQCVFNQRGGSVQVDMGPRRSFAALPSQPLTTAALSGCIKQRPFSFHSGRQGAHNSSLPLKLVMRQN